MSGMSWAFAAAPTSLITCQRGCQKNDGGFIHLSNEKKGPWLFRLYRGWDYTTQVYACFQK